MDRYGRHLASCRANGGHTQRLHNNRVQAEVDSMLNDAGVRTTGGKGIFIAMTQNGENGIIPDLVIDTTQVSRNNSALRKFADRSLADVKTLSMTDWYFTEQVCSGAVNRRQRLVNTRYHRHAAELDEAQGTPAGVIGPIRVRLKEFGMDGRVLVFGSGGVWNILKMLFTILWNWRQDRRRPSRLST